MPIDRPTFSESWYRVASLSPRLRGSVQVHRQKFRGQLWHVLQDPSNNQFFRLNEAAYHFVALLDGRRTVAETWKLCNEQLGDGAPTQGEAIQLMGQLYSSNLLQAELPPDAQGLLSRHRKRVNREVRSYLQNILFLRIPLLDPDRFLDAWVGVFGKLFSWYGMILWMVAVGLGGYCVIDNWDKLTKQTSQIINEHLLTNPANMVLMFLSFWVIKVFHEFGHAFACKKFGRQSGTGGEVHVMGLMLLVLTPIPYVDASSSSAFRNKWHKIIVGGAGMIVEMALAGVCAVIWAYTPEGTIGNSIAYSAMMIGSITTLAFNGNPLLRYDAYYILSDLLEIANLQQRSKDYLYYLVKRYVWGVKQARNPAHTSGERWWFVTYGIASTIYRTIVVVFILLLIADQFFVLGVMLAVASAIAWLFVPIGKFFQYLFTNNELMRVRSRAMATTFATIVLIVGGIGFVPWPDRVRVEGVIEPAQEQLIRSGSKSEGFVVRVLDSNTQVVANQTVLMEAVNPQLETLHQLLQLQKSALEVNKHLLDPVRESGRIHHIEHVAIPECNRRIRQAREALDDLKIKAPISGQWVCPQADRLVGMYVQPQEPIGIIIADKMVITAVAGQTEAPMLISESLDTSELRNVEIRFKGRPDVKMLGQVERVLPAGKDRLPSPSLALAAGGPIATDPSDSQGTRAMEEFFEIRIQPKQLDPNTPLPRMLKDQRVIVRFDLPEKPLALQWFRSIIQSLPQKFQL